jgi:hypothetical protein
MSKLTRDEIIECAINCAECNAYCHGCAIADFNGCENATSPAVRSLRDDYNAEVEKNKLLEAEIERLKMDKPTESEDKS